MSNAAYAKMAWQVDGFFTICLSTNPYTYFGFRPFDVAPGATGKRRLTAVTLRGSTSAPRWASPPGPSARPRMWRMGC